MVAISASGPLAGLRVFDLTIAGAGPRAGRMLAELGAEVLKVEPPNGDVMLNRPPTQHGWPVGYTHFNRGKKSLLLDLRNPEDLALAHTLARESDIFLNNMRPGVTERLHLGYEDLAALNPRIIYGYMSAWGRSGPLAQWPGADPVVQFFSGWCSIQGRDGGPAEFGRYVGHIDDSGAAVLVGGILQALLDRDVTGRGQRVDVSLLGSSLAVQLTRLSQHLAGSEARPLGSASSTTAPHQAFLCGDHKYLAVGVEHDDHWRAFCQVLSVPELAADPRFATNPDRVRHRKELARIIEEIFQRSPSNWIAILLERAGVPCSRFYDWENIKYHTQIRDNEYLSEVDVPHQGKMYLVNPPWEFSESPRPELNAPRPGEHTAEVRAWLRERSEGAAPTPERPAAGAAPDAAAAARPAPRTALTGITVIDVTQGLCGPFASQLFAQAGATVIKVEPPGGDYARRMGPPFVGGESAVFLALNRDKESVTLDVSLPEDRERLRGLIRRADVLLEDWGPDVAEERQLGYAQLRAETPRLVYASITAFGDRGPLRHRPASELIIQAMTEYHHGIGVSTDPPARVGADVASMSTGIYMFNAVLAALFQRTRTGKGQRISLSKFGTLIYARGTVWAAQGDPDDWDGWAARPFFPPDYGYKTKDGCVYFFIMRGDEEQFDGLMIALGLEAHLADPRFGGGGRDALGIGRYAAELKPIWEDAFRNYTTQELTEMVQVYGGLIAPLYDYESLFRDPNVALLKLLRDVEDPDRGTYTMLNPPWEFSALSTELGAPAPRPGQHTERVLRRFGLQDESALTQR